MSVETYWKWRKRFPEVYAEARAAILEDARAALGHLVPKAIRTEDAAMDLLGGAQSAVALRAAADVLDRVLHKPFVAPPAGVRRDITIRFLDSTPEGTRAAEVRVIEGDEE